MKRVRIIVTVGLISVLGINMQCDKDDDFIILEPIAMTNCDAETVLIDAIVYEETMDSGVVIESADIMDDCLHIFINASGCDSNNWEFDLIDSGLVAESSPVQRFIKLKFINPESCLAVFTKSLTFDLFEVRVEGESQIEIQLDGFNDTLIYNY